MSYILILICVRVGLATSDVQSILDIPATDEIHILNQAEQWHIHHAKQSTDLRVDSYISKKQRFEGQRFPIDQKDSCLACQPFVL